MYPWYLVWLTPFLITRSTRPLTAWTLASLTTYAVWANERSGVGWVLPAWVEPLEYGVVTVAALSLLWSGGSRGVLVRARALDRLERMVARRRVTGPGRRR